MKTTDENKKPDRLALSVLEFAQATGLSREHAYRLVQSGRVPARRVGRRWLIGVRALEAWLAGDNAPEATVG
ncbi:MAG: helix-turn-helix domain-containing protein [Myxococcales bacterium]|nr:helix-turn-helix domain-containing protein [Myxococcales bacterium]